MPPISTGGSHGSQLAKDMAANKKDKFGGKGRGNQSGPRQWRATDFATRGAIASRCQEQPAVQSNWFTQQPAPPAAADDNLRRGSSVGMLMVHGEEVAAGTGALDADAEPTPETDKPAAWGRLRLATRTVAVAQTFAQMPRVENPDGRMSFVLDEANIDKLRNGFDQMDEDHSGTLSIIELQHLFCALFTNRSEAEVQRITEHCFADIDQDEDDEITFDELMNFFQEKSAGTGELDDMLGLGELKALPKAIREWIWAIAEQSAGEEYDSAKLRATSVTVALCVQVVIMTSVVNMIVESELVNEDGSLGNFGTFIVETLCIAVFTLEFMLRLVSTPSMGAYWKAGFTWIDLLAILPYYLEQGKAMEGNSGGGAALPVLRVLRLLRLVRILRVAKLGKNAEGVQLMVVAVSRARLALGWAVIMIVMCIITFGSFIWYIEKEGSVWIPDGTNRCKGDPPCGVWVREESSNWHDAGLEIGFQTIQDAMWWALVTLTTVGYGDTYPETSVGKFVAGITMFVGLLVVSYPVTILCTHFAEVQKEFDDQKRRKRRREVFKQKLDAARRHQEAEEQKRANAGTGAEAKRQSILSWGKNRRSGATEPPKPPPEAKSGWFATMAASEGQATSGSDVQPGEPGRAPSPLCAIPAAASVNTSGGVADPPAGAPGGGGGGGSPDSGAAAALKLLQNPLRPAAAGAEPAHRAASPAAAPRNPPGPNPRTAAATPPPPPAAVAPAGAVPPPASAPPPLPLLHYYYYYSHYYHNDHARPPAADGGPPPGPAPAGGAPPAAAPAAAQLRMPALPNSIPGSPAGPGTAGDAAAAGAAGAERSPPLLGHATGGGGGEPLMNGVDDASLRHLLLHVASRVDTMCGEMRQLRGEVAALHAAAAAGGGAPPPRQSWGSAAAAAAPADGVVHPPIAGDVALSAGGESAGSDRALLVARRGGGGGLPPLATAPLPGAASPLQPASGTLVSPSEGPRVGSPPMLPSHHVEVTSPGRHVDVG